jgi:predicted helicase
VYYTPEPVVGYIVRSVHALLKDRFGKSEGLAAEGVTLLDPAAGTMTFVAEAARQAAAEYETRYGDGAKAEFVRDHILKNFHAFELMMAPYAVGHLKMSFLLEELGYTLTDDDRFKLYLTNTLEFEDLAQSELPGMRALSEESRLAGKVKKSQPVLVILGNPPYSGHSFNTGEWIRGLIDDYKQVDGKPLGERNPKWLQDDYVKFLRFAQWKIDQAGEGIVAMITNHGYLDNPTFRGMRQSLMQTFDTIHILNLHGNSLKKETAPDGGKDENVFDIRQGVAICLMVKCSTGKPPADLVSVEANVEKNATAKLNLIHHRDKPGGISSVLQSDLYGTRAEKYEWLDTRDVTTTDWTPLATATPEYLYIPRDETLGTDYKTWPSLPDIMAVNSTGIKTHRDHFVVDMDRAALKRRIETFRNPGFTDEMIAKAFDLKDSGAWKLKEARAALTADKGWESRLTRILYRPFDTRDFLYHSALVERGREDVMGHMLTSDNLALICPKQNKDEFGVLISTIVSVHKSVAAYETNYFFPLYLYPETKTPEKKTRSNRFTHMMLFEPEAQYGGKQPNLNPEILAALTAAYSNTQHKARRGRSNPPLLGTPGSCLGQPSTFNL